jgi:hypothetical protein
MGEAEKHNSKTNRVRVAGRDLKRMRVGSLMVSDWHVCAFPRVAADFGLACSSATRTPSRALITPNKGCLSSNLYLRNTIVGGSIDEAFVAYTDAQ